MKKPSIRPTGIVIFPRSYDVERLFCLALFATQLSTTPTSQAGCGRDWETGDIGSESCRVFLVVVLRWKLGGNKKDSGLSKRLWVC